MDRRGLQPGRQAERWRPVRPNSTRPAKPYGLQLTKCRKVGQVIFHPTASNVLTSASGDHLVRIWDIDQTDSPKITLKGHTDSIQSLAWNAVGTTLATVSLHSPMRVSKADRTRRAGTRSFGCLTLERELTRFAWLMDMPV